jgi:DNA polymerase III delta subunit
MPPRSQAPIALVWGEDAFLLREAALARFGDVHPAEVDAAEWRGGELQDLATPSLFGEPRALLIADARSLSKDATAELASYRARSIRNRSIRRRSMPTWTPRACRTRT